MGGKLPHPIAGKRVKNTVVGLMVKISLFKTNLMMMMRLRTKITL